MVQVLCGTQEQHISADVAYAVWHYWLATGDDAFLLAAGGEIILETARFWASRAVPEADGHRHIRGVIGPDEYHETIDDNAYTNIMARWNIRRGLDIAALMAERWPARWADLAARLGLDDAEFLSGARPRTTLVTGFDPQTGLLEQFTGFFELEEIDLAAYAGRTVPMDVVLGRERTQRSQVLKQADVVALMALLPEEFDLPTKVANFRYYEPRCGHGSSLSRAMHAVVAARLGETEMALRYFRETAATDLMDTAGGSAGGVHIAALGGLWLAAMSGFAGLSLDADALALDPRLPPAWRSFGFRVHWRGRVVKVHIEQDSSSSRRNARVGGADDRCRGRRAPRNSPRRYAADQLSGRRRFPLSIAHGSGRIRRQGRSASGSTSTSAPSGTAAVMSTSKPDIMVKSASAAPCTMIGFTVLSTSAAGITPRAAISCSIQAVATPPFAASSTRIRPT